MSHEIDNFKEKYRRFKIFCKFNDVYCVAIAALTVILALGIVSFILTNKGVI